MALHYKDIVPWGRNYTEYVRMFALSEADLRARILGCGDGPASFNCECNRLGGRVISVDPLYQFTAAEIERRIQETYVEVLQQTGANQDQFKWNEIPSLEELGRIRMEAMRTFLNAYPAGQRAGQYLPAALPHLPFAGQTFALALSSHFLFLYSDHLTEAFHLEALQEMLRAAREVRVFPILDLTGRPSPYLAQVRETFTRQGYQVEIRKVNYEFQRGGNEVLIIRG